MTVAAPVAAQTRFGPILPEQRTIRTRHPSCLCEARIANLPPPPTVADPQSKAPEEFLTLDDAIRIALCNSRVVRVLTGVSASSSGRTIYDPAISNTQIDEARGRFDPRAQIQNDFFRSDIPLAIPNGAPPPPVIIDGASSDNYDFSGGFSQTNVLGGVTSLNLNTNRTNFKNPGNLLDPRTQASIDLGYSQPLLQGGGLAANQVPIVLAQINTERSFFQLKDSVQELVRGVVDAYWAVVFARTDVWARQQQVDLAEEDFKRNQSGLEVGRQNLADVALSKTALANFRAGLVGAKANLLQREAAMRNILGLPPSQPVRLTPVTPPLRNHVQPQWDALLQLASVQRPDIIELKLLVEIDEQLLLQARNQNLPRLDATALYRLRGLRGVADDGTIVQSGSGQFTEWQLGLLFSLPLGLRSERATFRQQELALMRDRANLDQGLHAAVHQLAASLRNLEQFYAQYEAFRQTREAALENLQAQRAQYSVGRAIYLNVLQALSDWGNSVSSEAQSLLQYNTELATLERLSGTILETHGVRFFEDRYWSIGPAGRIHEELYPRAMPPSVNAPRYRAGNEPSEEFFELDNPVQQRDSSSRRGAGEGQESDPDQRTDQQTDQERKEADKRFRQLERELLKDLQIEPLPPSDEPPKPPIPPNIPRGGDPPLERTPPLNEPPNRLRDARLIRLPSIQRR